MFSACGCRFGVDSNERFNSIFPNLCTVATTVGQLVPD
jgi:hypothetical protein